MIAAGKRTQVQMSAPGAAAVSGLSTAVPGKRTLTQDLAMPPAAVTGDGVADVTTPDGVRADGPGAFLEPAQRQQIISDGANRWLACEDRCHAAILATSIREAVRPEDPMPLWVSILIDAAGIATMMAASRAADLAREHGAELLKDAGVWTALGARATGHEKALMALAKVSPMVTDAVLELGVSTGSKATERGAEGAHAESGETEKGGVMSVLDGFHDRMSVIFQGLREQVPARAVGAGDDAALLAWFRLADAIGPLTFAFWQANFQGKIDRFRAAELGKVGMTEQVGMIGRYAETRLQWRRDPFSGNALRLAVVDATADIGHPTDVAKARIVRWVPGEFEQAAIELSEARGMPVTGEHAEAQPTCALEVGAETAKAGPS